MATMRIRNQWFRGEKAKSVSEIAGAVAFIVSRIAQQVLRDMRRADFEIDAGPAYFDFLAEWLVFLIQTADRLAFERLGEGREEFTTVLSHRVGETLADNRADLLGDASPAQIKDRFIDLVNERLADYAGFDQVGYDCFRYLADRLVCVVGVNDRNWVHSQVMEYDAPRAVETAERGFRGLMGDLPRRSRAQAPMGAE